MTTGASGTITFPGAFFVPDNPCHLVTSLLATDYPPQLRRPVYPQQPAPN